MKSLNEILELLQDWLEDDSIDASFIRYINFAVDQAESFVDWLGLYGEKTVTVGSDGMTKNPESNTEDGYLTVKVGSTSYQVPMYAA